MTFKSHVATWRKNERTVSSCVWEGECPSAETMVGVLQHKGQPMRPVGKEVESQYKLARPEICQIYDT